MAILGIDQSYSGLASVFLETHPVETLKHLYLINDSVVAFTPAEYGSGVKRLRSIQDHISERITRTEFDGPLFVFMEGYAHGSKFGREIAGELSAAIRLELMRYIPEEDIYIVQPLVLKKFATGSGKASKEQMIAKAKEYGYLTRNDNLADAFHLARLGHKLLYNSFDNSFEKEVIDDIKGINNGTNKQGRKGSSSRRGK